MMDIETKTEKPYLSKPTVVFVLSIFCCFLWGSAFPCIKIGYQIYGIASADIGAQIIFAGCRFLLAGMLTVLAASIGKRRILFPKPGSASKIVILSLLQTIIQYLFFYIGLANTTGVKASIIGGTNVFLAILTASLLFHQEKMTKEKILGCILGFSGVVLVNIGGAQIEGSIKIMGEGFILISTIAYAFSAVFLKKFSKYENPVVLSGYQFMLGGMVLIIFGYLKGGRIVIGGIREISILFYLAFVSAAAYSVWGILLKHNPVSKVSVYGFTNPLFGVILSAMLLKEKNQAFGSKSIIALLLVCAGIFIVNRKKTEKDRV